jgi:hypothetical protein
MDFQKLQALGGIVSSALVPKEIKFTRPRTPEEGEGEPITESATIHVRKRTSRDFLDIVKVPESERPFLAIFRCVCAEDGTPLLPSVDDASRLAEWMLMPILNAVNEVNSFDPKGFPPRTTSGSNSPSLSAVAASRSGKRPSRKKNGPAG